MNGTDPNVVIDGEPWTVDEMRRFAVGMRDQHSDENCRYRGRRVCAVCHYLPHPCDTFNLASIVLALLPDIERPTP